MNPFMKTINNNSRFDGLNRKQRRIEAAKLWKRYKTFNKMSKEDREAIKQVAIEHAIDKQRKLKEETIQDETVITDTEEKCTNIEQ